MSRKNPEFPTLSPKATLSLARQTAGLVRQALIDAERAASAYPADQQLLADVYVARAAHHAAIMIRRQALLAVLRFAGARRSRPDRLCLAHDYDAEDLAA